MFNTSLLTATGFTDESFDTGTDFMRRDCEEVGNLTVHCKTFVRCTDGNTVNAWQSVNVYITGSMRHLYEYATPEDERSFTSTEEALSALGFDADHFRHRERVRNLKIKKVYSMEIKPLHWFDNALHE